MKYRKIGLRMCIIAIIMIALCIPNQIQIANAAEGNSEVSFKVWDDNGEWAENSTNSLNVFPKKKSGYQWNVEPGSTDDYTFYVENNIGYKATCEIRLEAKVSQRTDLDTVDTTYPIKFQLYKRENDDLTKLLGSTGKNPLDYPAKTITHTETLNNGETCEYVLSWLFEEVDSTFNGGNYDFTLKVNAKQVTETNDNPVTPPNPDNPNNPDTPDNPNKPDDGNKDDDNKKDDNNNSNNNGNNGNSGNNGSNSNNNNSDNNSNDKGNNTNNGSDDSKGNESSNNNQENNQNNNQNNLNIDNTSNKGTGSTTTNKKKVNTSDITTPVIYVALMILTFGLILLVKGRKEN